MRLLRLTVSLSLLVIGLPTLGTAQRASPEPGTTIPGGQLDTDLPGGDYRYSQAPGLSPQACFDACQADQQCRAWTSVRPGVQGPRPDWPGCWLKATVPQAVSGQRCCLSGTK